MIVATAQKFTEQSARLRNLEENKQQVNTLGQIRVEFDDLQPRLDAAMNAYHLVLSRLSDDDRARVHAARTTIQKRLWAARDAFTNGSPAVNVGLVREATDTLQRELNDGWQRYVNAEVYGYDGLLRLVRGFPQFTVKTQVLEEQIAQARKRNKAPVSDLQLANFDTTLAQLKENAKFIEELPRDVRVLLDRVVQGDATLANISDEAWQWLREGDHLRSLTVTFSGGRG